LQQAPSRIIEQTAPDAASKSTQARPQDSDLPAQAVFLYSDHEKSIPSPAATMHLSALAFSITYKINELPTN
jgi:hypothetical protein